MGAPHHSTKVKALAIDDARQGETPRAIARKSSVPLRTVQDWLKHARDLAQLENRDPMLVDREYRLTFMGQELQEVQLAELQAKVDAGESILSYMVPLNILKGTSFDKTTKTNSAVQVNIQFNYIKRSERE